MLSYIRWAFGGFQSDASSTASPPSSLLEAEACQHDLRTITCEEEEMENSLLLCLQSLRRARKQREVLEQGYEQLLMSTHDGLEHSVLRREVDGDIISRNASQGIFQLQPTSLERVKSVKIVEEEEDLSSPDASDYSDEEIANAFRQRKERDRSAVVIDCPKTKPSATESSVEKTNTAHIASCSELSPSRTITVYHLFKLTPNDFVNPAEFAEWEAYYALWKARNLLTSKATRYEVLGKVTEECDKLDERLFELRIRLSAMKAKKKKADYQLEAYQECTSHYDAPTVPPNSVETMNVEMACVRDKNTAPVPREVDAV